MGMLMQLAVATARKGTNLPTRGGAPCQHIERVLRMLMVQNSTPRNPITVRL